MKLGIVMDPISKINIKKDSSFAMLLEAQSRKHEIHYMQALDVQTINGEVIGDTKKIKLQDDADNWFEFADKQTINLSELDVILIRNDPPFDSNYLYLTQMLEQVENTGTQVVNKPSAIRDYNEKLAINLFADLAPPSLVSSKIEKIKQFLDQHKKIVIKPLDSMGGNSIFVVKKNDNNANVIFETMTIGNTKPVMVQKFIPQISQGDKRILIIDGKPVPYSLARIPGKDDFRGNLAKGASAVGKKLNKKEIMICDALSSFLKKQGLMFVGIDIIGDYLTEINVTSPTGIRELDKMFDLNIASLLFDAIETRLS